MEKHTDRHCKFKTRTDHSSFKGRRRVCAWAVGREGLWGGGEETAYTASGLEDLPLE